MADGSTKAIEKVRTGDKVIATDPTTGETRVQTVTAEIRGKGLKRLVRLTVDSDGRAGSKTARITATAEHPFWVPELGRWLDATDLEPGQWLGTSAGTHVQVTGVQRWTALDAAVHNLTVGDLHTYYALAGAAPVLVHNDSCPTGGGNGNSPTYVGTPKDPGVPRLVDEIEARYPGHVVAVEIKIVGADGKDITDFDIVTRNAVIQVKTGRRIGIQEGPPAIRVGDRLPGHQFHLAEQEVEARQSSGGRNSWARWSRPISTSFSR